MNAPLVGWRGWTLHGGRLVGATGWPWTSRIRRAWCGLWHSPGDVHVPFDRCVCGLYAYKQQAMLLTQTYPIWGQVSLWGQVAIHEYGLRAEWARIDRLWTPYDSCKRTLVRIFPTLCEDPDGGLAFLDDDLDAELQILSAQAEWEGRGLEEDLRRPLL